MSLADSGRAGITTLEQLQRAIGEDLWYDSEGSCEDDIIVEDLDLELEKEARNSQWRSIVWDTKENRDDPLFHDATHDEDLDAIINGLLEHIDFTETTDEETDATDLEDTKIETGSDVVSPEKHEDLVKEDKSISTHQESSNDNRTLQAERPKYYSVAYELMTSERTYVQNLKLIEKVVHGAIRTANLTGRSILPEQARKEIFLNIGEIYALSFDLLQELEDRLSNWDSDSSVMDVLAKRAPFFKLYSMYSSRFDNSQLSYCKWTRKSKKFSELIRNIEMSCLCKGLHISSYMLCPIQRIPRYRLLLEDYLKHLPEDHTDRVNTEAALTAIVEAALLMNSRITDLENQAKVVKMQRNFTGKESLVAPGRKYLGRGPVFFVPGSKKQKQRVLFLFSDILMVTGITASRKYQIRHKISLKDMIISEVLSPILKNAFCVAEKGVLRPIRFCTKSLDERDQWIKELNCAKATLEERSLTPRTITKYASVLDDPETHTSILAVLNDPLFELGHPSWVRRSLRMSQSVRTALPLTMYTPPSKSVGDSGARSEEGSEEVDTPTIAEVKTEFMSGISFPKEQILRAGQENMLLSGYLEQQSLERGGVWKKRWFVLTSRNLICYDDSNCIEATGAMNLSGYSISLVPTSDDGINRPCVFKLTQRGHRSYFFHITDQCYFERWFHILKELLDIINM